MKLIRWTLPLISMCLSVQVFAQSDAQKSFDKLKTLSGVWEGKVTTDMKVPESFEKIPMHVVLRTTSRGNALMHEMSSTGSPDDPRAEPRSPRMIGAWKVHTAIRHTLEGSTVNGTA